MFEEKLDHRTFLDAVLPDGPATLALAARIVGHAPSGDLVSRCLLWLAETTESDIRDRFGTEPEWRRQSNADWHVIRASGLSHKDSECYLTSQGWLLGSTCWYVFVEGYGRFMVAAATPELAAARGVIFVEALRRRRATAPALRTDLKRMLLDLGLGAAPSDPDAP